eukprot:scaffold6155_cov108-Cylindrotheca_fusiformis.AAC.7
MPFLPTGWQVLSILLSSLLFSLSTVPVVAQVCSNDDNSEPGACQAPAENAQVGSNGMGSDEIVEEAVQSIVTWVRDQGGFIHPSLAIGYKLKPDDEQVKNDPKEGDLPSYDFGIYVKSGEPPIEKGEQILYIPRSTMIGVPEKGNFLVENVCLLADRLAEELHHWETTKTSKFGPYIDFLDRLVLYEANLPATWSTAGKDLLVEITEDADLTTFTMYTQCFEFDIFTGSPYQSDYEDDLDDDEYLNALIEAAVSRGRDNNLVPIFDFINHSNDPKKINMALSSKIDAGTGFGVHATRNIVAGEEILYSYGLGTPTYDQEHGVMDYGIGTVDLLGLHGFVEDYPQRWHFAMHSVDFAISRTTSDSTGSSTSIDEAGDLTDRLELTWRSGQIPDDDAVSHFQEELDRLSFLQKELRAGVEPTIPDIEVRILGQFLSAYRIALKLVIDAASSHGDPDESKYALNEETVVINNVDQRLFQVYQCNTLIQRVFDQSFETIDSMQSAYQEITYYRNPKTNDTCLYLDGVYQICTSYWPHYHELVVHKSSKYLKEDLKRVLWVGGGDSGPLNEFLKYPNLELAVGLELDQHVTRLAFKHLASQPHYDNPKVQWWYGDASKSILMLPKEYFGSFDLVIVDLSDTVFSLSVSEELDVIEALSLLLRPGGIFDMNELFFKKVSNVFEYAVHYAFHDVPQVCDQSAIFASNDVDFMYRDIHDQELMENSTLLIEQDSMKTKHQFDRIHDYRHNPNPGFKKLCKKMKDGQKEDKQQSQAPGIMMIVEAENLSEDLSNPAIVRNSIAKEIDRLGLTVISDKAETTISSRFVVMMAEGYVIARLYPEAKYCALDIHLWSAFDSHEALKQGIVEKALGGSIHANKSTSSYRIVAGGMFGLSNWKATSETHGPQISQVCPEETAPKRDSPSDDSVFKLALKTSLDVVRGKDGLTVAVICGEKETEGGCPSLEVVENHPKFKRVIPIYECPSNEGMEWSERVSCSVGEAQEELNRKLTKESDQIHVIVFDASTSKVASSLFGTLKAEDHVDPEDVFVIATTDSKEELWRRRLVELIRVEIEMDPVFRSQLLFNTTSSSLEISLAASGDPFFMEHLTKAVSATQKETVNVTLEIRNIVGGYWREEKKHLGADWEFSQVTVSDDYNHDDARAQWKSQTAVAAQALLQFSNYIDGAKSIVEREDLVNACNSVFSSRPDYSLAVYDGNFGADGIICAGGWDTGSAVISWDGRYQVDFNIFSENGLEEVTAFEADMKMKLPTLGGWLRDFQPRGYGRVVNFKEDIEGEDNFFDS